MVKSYAGIAGNECADAEAKYQATQLEADSNIFLQAQVLPLMITKPGLHLKGIFPPMQPSQVPQTYLPQSSFTSQTSMML